MVVNIPICAPVGNHTDLPLKRLVFYSSSRISRCKLSVYIILDGQGVSLMPGYLLTLHKMTNGNLLPNKIEKIDSVDVPLFMIDDRAYPLQSWLMRPFPYMSTLTQEQQHYNYMISSAKIVVENNYGRLKKEDGIAS